MYAVINPFKFPVFPLYEPYLCRMYLFQTDRIGFRGWLPTDETPYIEMNLNQEVMRYFPRTFTAEESRAAISRFSALLIKEGFTFFAVDHLETGEFMGFIGLYKPSFEADFTPCVEIGWRLRPQFWNQGLATEGAKACLEYARDILKLDTIYSFTATTNLPSARVMQKIGMEYQRDFDHPLVEGPLKPHVLYRINL